MKKHCKSRQFSLFTVIGFNAQLTNIIMKP